MALTAAQMDKTGRDGANAARQEQGCHEKGKRKNRGDGSDTPLMSKLASCFTPK